jgi:hypothetical protein
MLQWTWYSFTSDKSQAVFPTHMTTAIQINIWWITHFDEDWQWTEQRGEKEKKSVLRLRLALHSCEYLKIQLNSIQMLAAMGGEDVSL